MTGILFRSGAPVSSIHPFTAAFNATTPGSASVLAGLLSGQNISTTANDPYGIQDEQCGGGCGAADVSDGDSGGGGHTQACVSNVEGDDNKLGSFAYLRFNAPANRDYQFTVKWSRRRQSRLRHLPRRLDSPNEQQASAWEPATTFLRSTISTIPGHRHVSTSAFNRDGPS
jgi:hypothetical protein